jgi:hypothetical protein
MAKEGFARETDALRRELDALLTRAEALIEQYGEDAPYPAEDLERWTDLLDRLLAHHDSRPWKVWRWLMDWPTELRQWLRLRSLKRYRRGLPHPDSGR